MKLHIFIILIVLTFTACEQESTKTINNAENIVTRSIHMDDLTKFKHKAKFIEDKTINYSGVADPTLKNQLTEKINLAAKDFEEVAKRDHPTVKDYQEKIEIGLHRFNDIYINLDTEERERICHYFEELMDIVGLESSDGKLNKFMYGFDPSAKQ